MSVLQMVRKSKSSGVGVGYFWTVRGGQAIIAAPTTDMGHGACRLLQLLLFASLLLLDILFGQMTSEHTFRENDVLRFFLMSGK